MFVKGLSTPNTSFTIEEKLLFPTIAGDICAVDIYGSLPYLREMFGIYLCVMMFSKFIKLFALKSVTTKACLNNLVNQYFDKVIKPKVILSDKRSRTRPKGACDNCQSSAASTVMTTTKSG
jgi:hypothetical protein